MSDDYVLDRKLELWQHDIHSFERYKRCAYEFIKVPVDGDTPFRLYGGRVDFPIDSFYEDGQSVITDERTLQAVRQGVEAIVEAISDDHFHNVHGMPVRKAKGKLLKNIILKYLH